MTTGAFTTDFARQKNWKLDEGLFRAITWLFDKELNREEHAIIDLGAGIGRYVQALRDAGWRYTIGADAIPGINELSRQLVLEVDLTDPYVWTRLYNTKYKQPAGWRPDAAMFIETAEHIPRENHEQLWDNVGDSVKAGGLLVVSVAVPGQRGKGHISCMMPEAVACELGRRGCVLLEEQTTEARELAGKGWNKKLLVLRKT